MRTDEDLLFVGDRSSDQRAVLSVGKAMAIVEMLMRSGAPVPARVIADELALNRSTVHRLLRSLVQQGWVEKPPATAAYRLGIRFLALAHVATQSRSFLDEIRVELEGLSQLTRETIHVGIRDGFEVLHIERIDSPERVGVASKIGGRATLHTTGLGKAMLAASDDAFLDDYFSHVEREEVAPRIDTEMLRFEINLTRRRGYSIDDEDDSVGVRCLGVAILGAGGTPLFAVSITGPSPRFTREHVLRYAPAARETARMLSRNLGWEGAGELSPDDELSS